MFTFRTTTLLFFLFLLLMFIFTITGVPIHYIYYFILIAGYVTVSVTASFFICSGFHMKALCSRKTKQKVIAVTYDDGPHPENTSEILDVLKGRAKATFFCIGKKAEGNESLLRRMNDEGHLIGTHSYTHSYWFDLYSPKRMRSEFLKSEEVLFKIIGKKPLFFRPPYGVINPLLKKALKSFSYHIIGFNNRSWDTVTKDENKILERMIRRLKPGDIVLLHETVPFAANLLKNFLFRVSEKGYMVIGLDELLTIHAYDE